MRKKSQSGGRVLAREAIVLIPDIFGLVECFLILYLWIDVLDWCHIHPYHVHTCISFYFVLFSPSISLRLDGVTVAWSVKE